MKHIERFPHMFFRQAPYLVLSCLDKMIEKPNGTLSKKRRMNQRFFWYGSRISRETKVTYSHVHHLLQDMIAEGLVRSKKVGRITAYELTNKGQVSLDKMNKLVSVLRNHFKS